MDGGDHARRPAGFDAYPRGYGKLFDKAVEVSLADDRVRAMWLHGAFARGAADRASDLDIDIAVTDDSFEEFASSWTGWLAKITPTVSAVPLSPGSFYALTPTCERIDIITERVSSIPTTTLTRRVVIFDRDNLTSQLPPIVDPAPNREIITYLIAETLRQAANFETVTVRHDWLLGVVAIQTVHLHLYRLFAEANKPQPATGPKQWSSKLSPQHRKLLEALPVPQPNHESIMTARSAAFELFFAEVPAIAAANDVPWPAALDEAVTDYLGRLGLPIK